MNLEEANEKNLSTILDSLANYLQVINREMLDPKYFDLSYYEEIKSIYEMIKAKGQLSVSEIHAIIDELRNFRLK